MQSECTHLYLATLLDRDLISLAVAHAMLASAACYSKSSIMLQVLYFQESIARCSSDSCKCDMLMHRYGARIPQDAVKSLRLCLTHMWKQEGVKGFYKGSLPSIIKAAPSAAVTFATYEFVIRYFAMTNAQGTK